MTDGEAQVCIHCGLGFTGSAPGIRLIGHARYEHVVPDCKDVARRVGGEGMRRAALRIVVGEVGVLYDHDFGVVTLLEEAFPEYFTASGLDEVMG